jgi:hypothetical protein
LDTDGACFSSSLSDGTACDDGNATTDNDVCVAGVCIGEDACADVDADGVCDDVDDCVGEYDDCSVCNGDGTSCRVDVTFSVDISATITGIGTINFESIREREWISGYNTFSNPFDDVYSINGTASGNSSNGRNFEVNITEDLYVNLSCLSENTCMITSGQTELIPEGFKQVFSDKHDKFTYKSSVIFTSKFLPLLLFPLAVPFIE